MISGVLVVVKPERGPEARAALETLGWAQVHHADVDGRWVITIEASDTEEAIARLRHVQELPFVARAEMVEHYVEDDSTR